MSEDQPTSDQDLPAGTQVGEYVIERKLGEGGMGAVYAGAQPLIGKRVAVKVVAAAWARNEQVTKRFLEEARAVNLIRNPHIIDIFSFGVLPDGRPYFVMELLQGESLEEALTTNRVTGWEVVLLLRQLCAGLEAAHTAGFVHRDLKPENLWIARQPNQDASLKILDFGIAKNLSTPAAGMTVDGQVLGTAHYMAPEQAMARSVDARTDIYALGVILYRILAGALPFDGDSIYAVVTKHVTETPVPPSRHRPVPPALEAVVLDCLAKDPTQRPQTMGELWERLEPELEDWAGPPPPARMTGARSGAGTRPRVSIAPQAVQSVPSISQVTIPPVAGVTGIQAPPQKSGGRTPIVVGFIAVLLVAGGAVAFLTRGPAPTASAVGPAAAPPSSAGPAAAAQPPSAPPVGAAASAPAPAPAAAPAPSPAPSPAVTPPVVIGSAAPDARPADGGLAAQPAAVSPAPASPAPAPAPIKKRHRERPSLDTGGPQAL